uniref:Uncharacterized protein n=1 Tax=Arundo donax TaxID=35708 RepID=A0A0A9H9H5_ARUDO
MVLTSNPCRILSTSLSLAPNFYSPQDLLLVELVTAADSLLRT